MAILDNIYIHFLPFKSDMHSHEHWEIFYCLEKRGSIKLEDEEILTYEPNQIVLIPPNTLHSTISDDKKSLISLALLNWYPNHSGVLILNDNNDAELKQLLIMCHRFYNSTDSLYSALVVSTTQVIVDLLQSISGYEQLPQHVQTLENYIITHFSDTAFDLNDAVMHAGLCMDYARRLFLKHKGLSLLQFLMHTRLNNAEKLLISTKLPITEVAMLCGFADPLYFSRIFKKKIGVTPQSYSSFKK